MNNIRLSRVAIFQKYREAKKYRRLRKKKKYRGHNSTVLKIEQFKKEMDRKIISSFSFETDEFLNSILGIQYIDPADSVSIPRLFSLERNYDESILILWNLRKLILFQLGKNINIDFSNCEKVDFGILFLMKVLLEEYLSNLKRLNNKLQIYNVVPIINIKLSPFDNVNLKLVANKIISDIDLKDNEFIPISTLPLIKGTKSQKHYTENKKGSATTKIRNFINEGLSRHKVCLSNTGEGLLDGLISEVLNNAEDHSPLNTWYAFGNLFETNRKSVNSDIVGEINLAVLNFGNSIFEGFEDTKEQNYEIYDNMQRLYETVISKSKNNQFTKENLFTLISLQEGISRLRYKEESRGTGTMKFITSFLNIGDYQDEKKDYIPRLLIYSGFTSIRCDNKFKPFRLDGVNYLSLNEENDLTLPPAKSHLIKLDNKFPGTLLIAKIYLNENHLSLKVKQNGSD